MNVDRIVRHLDPVPIAPRVNEEARELCAEITALPREAGRTSSLSLSSLSLSSLSRRRWIALPFAAGFAAVILALTWLLPGMFGMGSQPASAALDVHRAGGYYIVTVKDLFADPGRYQAQLKAHGLNVSLRLTPVTPTEVGRPFVLDPKENGLTDAQARLRKDLITSTYHPGHCADPQGCAIGLKIPIGYDGRAVIYLGRQARPGESYQNPPELDAPDGPLHCVTWLKKSVDQVRLLLRRRGVTTVTFADAHGGRTSVPGSWYVHDGVLSGPGKAILLVGPTLKRPDAPGPIPLTHDRQGC